MTPPLAIAGFLAGAAAVVAAGTVLARAGDAIGARTGLGGVWVGSLLVAAATSLPEFATDVPAVLLGLPDLAVGDLFGSSMANMLLLGVICLAVSEAPLFARVTLDHALYASLAIELTAVATVTLLLRPAAAVGPVGLGSLLVLALYLAQTPALARGTRLASASAATAETAGGPGEAQEPEDVRRGAVRRDALRFAAAAVVVLFAAPLFAASSGELAAWTGLGATFVGTWLVGAATSLPELATSLAAVRGRAYDLAVGNLFGSNAFNMVLLVALDVAHGAPIVGVASPSHAVSGLAAIALMATALSALVYRSERRASLLEPTGLLMVVVYMAGLGAVYLAEHGV